MNAIADEWDEYEEKSKQRLKEYFNNLIEQEYQNNRFLREVQLEKIKIKKQDEEKDKLIENLKKMVMEGARKQVEIERE